MQLILVMSRHAELYILDEPIGGVDPAARDYILQTIIQNRTPQSSVIISTHLIADIEPILDEVILINQGQIFLHENANTTLSLITNGIVSPLPFFSLYQSLWES